MLDFTHCEMERLLERAQTYEQEARRVHSQLLGMHKDSSAAVREVIDLSLNEAERRVSRARVWSNFGGRGSR